MVKSLADLRRARKLTQTELGQLVGVSQRSIAAYEAGERKPSPKVMNRLIEELGMTLTEAWGILYKGDSGDDEEG